MYKKMGSVLLILIMVFAAVTDVYAATPAPAVLGETAVVIDGATGVVIYEKNSHKSMYPASTTKIMTAILALENLDADYIVTVGKNPPKTAGSSMHLAEGEKITVEQLVHGLLMESANDAAVALAEEVSGSVDDFAKLMNDKMKAVGGTNTNFVNPNGLHDSRHKTSAYDLAMISRYAMKNQTFRQVVATTKYSIPATNKRETRALKNSNSLLAGTKTMLEVDGVQRPAKYEGATGIKTGFTDEAGSCLVASAKKGETELIAVTLNSQSSYRFADCIALLDWGFDNYKTLNPVKKGEIVGEIKVKRGAVGSVKVTLREEPAMTVRKEVSNAEYAAKVELKEVVEAPVKKGDVVGKVKIYRGAAVVKEIDALAESTVERGGPLSVFGISDATATKIGITGAVMAAVAAALALWYNIMKQKQDKRRLQRRKERQDRMEKKEEMRKNQWERLDEEKLFDRSRREAYRNPNPNYPSRETNRQRENDK